MYLLLLSSQHCYCAQCINLPQSQIWHGLDYDLVLIAHQTATGPDSPSHASPSQPDHTPSP